MKKFYFSYENNDFIGGTVFIDRNAVFKLKKKVILIPAEKGFPKIQIKQPLILKKNIYEKRPKSKNQKCVCFSIFLNSKYISILDKLFAAQIGTIFSLL